MGVQEDPVETTDRGACSRREEMEEKEGEEKNMENREKL